MIKFRRAIAICILALFTCQSILAGVDEHGDHSSSTDVVQGLHMQDSDRATADSPEPGQPFVPTLIDGDCCHAHGHCHLLAFSGQIAGVSMPRSHGLVALPIDAYSSLAPGTLLRPPTHA